MSAEEGPVLEELEIELQAELRIVERGRPEDVFAQPLDEWLFDPTDVERYRVGIYGLIGAVKAVETGREEHDAIEL